MYYSSLQRSITNEPGFRRALQNVGRFVVLVLVFVFLLVLEFSGRSRTRRRTMDEQETKPPFMIPFLLPLI
jgi:hypothetical protein